MKRRACNHLSDLKHGRHRSARARDAFAVYGNATWKVLRNIPFEWGETEQLLKAKLYAAEQDFISLYHGTNEFLNVSKTSIGATCPRPDVAKRWTDPAFREKIKASRKSREASPLTRSRMSAAKRGVLNPKSRAVIFEFQGKQHQFDCVTDAARHFGVSQQSMEGWLAGRFPWPGRGVRVSRAGKHLDGIVGRYAQSQ